MRNKAGIVCMVLGAALIIGALALFLHNRNEAAEAEETTLTVMPQLIEEIVQKEETEEVPQTYVQPVGTPIEYLDPSAFEMTEVEIDGYAYIGYISIPKLELELPVMADWDYDRLKIAPCRYVGSVRGDDLVLMAHNYRAHFGGISKLSEGDMLVFTDMDGIATVYEVVGQDILLPTDVEEMTAKAFDLTLFTCTYGGKTRVTVYCNKIA